jgi:hypothetical protein
MTKSFCCSQRPPLPLFKSRKEILDFWDNIGFQHTNALVSTQYDRPLSGIFPPPSIGYCIEFLIGSKYVGER